jgi:hypothetical protein
VSLIKGTQKANERSGEWVIGVFMSGSRQLCQAGLVLEKEKAEAGASA